MALPRKMPMTTSRAVVGSSLSLIKAEVNSSPKTNGSITTRMKKNNSGSQLNPLMGPLV